MVSSIENDDDTNISLNDTQYLLSQERNNATDIDKILSSTKNSKGDKTNEDHLKKSYLCSNKYPEGETHELITSLDSWGLPENILIKYKERGISNMFQWQVECLKNKKVLENSNNLVYSAPTSAGKTLVAEILALKTLLEKQKKVIIILPFVSVVREKMFYFQNILSASGIRVEGFMGSHSPPGGFKAVQMAICTIEKANSIINRLLEENTLTDIGAVIIDEMHLLGDSSRGYLLELLLTKLRYMSIKIENKIQLIGMSATLPNLDLLSKWLNAELYTTTFRPIPLEEFYLISNDIFDTKLQLYRRLESIPDLTEDTDNILQLCLETISKSCSVLIFCPTKNWCENLAQQISVAFWKLGKSKSRFGKYLRDQLDGNAISETLEQLKRCPVGLDSILKKTASFGVAFHHAGLTMDERDIIEGAFRNGALRVLVATSTLSSGVNLPAQRVIVRTPMFHGKPIDSLTYRQMIGRAGRMGKDTSGESILICQKNDKRIAEELLSANLHPIESCLEGAGKLKRAILEVIASGVATTPEDISLFTNCTLLATSMEGNVGVNNPIEHSVEFLIKNEFIRLQTSDNGELKYVATNLAKACLSSSLPPEDGLALFEEIERARQCFVLDSDLHLLYLVTPYSVCSQWSNLDWMLYLDIWEKLSPSMKRVAELVGVQESFIFNATRGRISTSTNKQYHRLQIHRRFYTALALQDLVNEIPLNQVANKFQCNRGMLQSLQQSASMFAGMVTSFCSQLGWKNIEILISQFQDRLQFGIQHELLELMKLSNLNGQRARALYNAGVETLSDLAALDICKLENILLSSVPFESEKERDGETAYDVEQKKKIRGIFITGKQGLTARDAANMLIKDAREYLQLEIGAAVMKWDTNTLVETQNNSNNCTNSNSESKPEKIVESNTESNKDTLINHDDKIKTSLNCILDTNKTSTKQIGINNTSISKKSELNIKKNLNCNLDTNKTSTKEIEINNTSIIKKSELNIENSDNLIKHETLQLNCKTEEKVLKKTSLVKNSDIHDNNDIENELLNISESKNKTESENMQSDRINDSVNNDTLQSISLEVKETNIELQIETKLDENNLSNNDSLNIFSNSELEYLDNIHSDKENKNMCNNNNIQKNDSISKTVNTFNIASLELTNNSKLELTPIHKNESLSKTDNSFNIACLELTNNYKLELTSIRKNESLSKTDHTFNIDTLELTNSSNYELIPVHKKESVSKKENAFNIDTLELTNSSNYELTPVHKKESVSKIENAFNINTLELTNTSKCEFTPDHKNEDKLKSFDNIFESLLNKNCNPCSDIDEISSISSTSNSIIDSLLDRSKTSEKSNYSFTLNISDTESTKDMTENKNDNLNWTSFDMPSFSININQNSSENRIPLNELKLNESSGNNSMQSDTSLFGESIYMDSKICNALDNGVNTITMNNTSVLDSASKVFNDKETLLEEIFCDENNENQNIEIEENNLDVVETSQTDITENITESYNSIKKSKRKTKKTSFKRNHSSEENNVQNFLSFENTPTKKRKLENKKDDAELFYNIKDSNIESVDLASIDIIDVCKNKLLFETFKKEIITRTEISLACACEEIKIDKPLIGQNIVQPSISNLSHNNENRKIYDENRLIAGIAISHGDNTVYFISFTNEEIISNEEKIKYLQNILNKKNTFLRIFDYKEHAKILYRSCHIVFHTCVEDPKMADWLLEPESKEKNLSSMALKYAPEAVGIAQLAGSCKGVGSVALNTTSAILSKIRASVEALVTWHIVESQKNILLAQDNKLLDTFQIEMKTLSCLAQMEIVGFKIDREKMNQLISAIQEQMALLQQEAFSKAGRQFSFISSKDVANVLNLNKGGKISTNKQTLEQCKNPVASLILQWRKLNYTLTKTIYPIIRSLKNDRIHGCCITNSSTGRISMHEPNVQNVPRNFEIIKLDKTIVSLSTRAAFIPSNDKIFISADYCQLELRLLAHLSQDTVLCDIMRKEGDVFKSIASKLNKISENQVTDDLRQRAKQLCYGIIYGMGAKALAEQLNSTEEDAVKFTNSFRNTYPKIQDFIHLIINQCKENGYVKTLGGRRRYLSHINHENPAIKSQAERQAVNTTIQGSAADLVKNAMVLIEEHLLNFYSINSDLKTSLVLHLHDELLYEVPFEHLQDISKIVKNTMEKSVDLSIPFPVKLKCGVSWGELEEFSI